MRPQELLDPATGQARHLVRGPDDLEQGPEPGFIGRRHELEHLGEEAMDLLAEAVSEAGELVPQVVVHARVLAQLEDDGILETHLAESRSIGPERGAQHERVTAIVLGSGHGVAVAEAIQLLGIERVYVEAALHKCFDDRPPRNLNRHAHPLRPVPRQVDEPRDELPDRAPACAHTPLRRRAPVFIADPDLVRLGCPIDADKPCVRVVLCANGSLPSHVVTHLDRPWCLVTPVQALVARLPTGRAPRPTSSRRMSPLGDSRRWGPLGALDEAAEDSSTEFPARRRGARVPLSIMVQGAAMSVSPQRRLFGCSPLALSDRGESS